MNLGPTLNRIHLWEDAVPRLGAENMAYDEAMLQQAQEPWLRIYSWREPSISIGFSQSLEKVPKEQSHWPVVRRWTGGGVVVHDGDWTYTLAVPASFAFSQASAASVYRLIHECFIAALQDCGISDAALQPESVSDGMGVCFVEPARHDIVWQGNKIAGAAQRRAKLGLLHQGSVQGIDLPAGLGLSFAAHLAEEVLTESPPEVESRLREMASSLATTKYGTAEWLNDRKVTPIPA